MTADLLIRNAMVSGRHCDVLIENGVIVEIGANLRARAPTLNANDGDLLPGLIDHHIHLFATAAQARSLTVSAEMNFAAAVRRRDRSLPKGQDLRITGYYESFYGPLDAARLDALIADRPVRVQYRTGSLWVLNTAALKTALKDGDAPDCVECGPNGQPTGRIWRGDAWLRGRFRAGAPSLAELSHDLARQGVTHLTDASASTDDATAGLFETALARGELRQHLMVMSAHPLKRPTGARWRLGPVKILLDDHALPDVDTVAAVIADARAQNRAVAVHCVAAGELAVTLAAFAAAGARPGDRVEHGGIITAEGVAEIARLGLTVVTQPGFIAERGAQYRDDVAPADLPNLYRCASLLQAGIKVGGSTDAPYTRPDVWAAIRAAIHRATSDGMVLGRDECLSPERALALFQTSFVDPGGPSRRVEIGAPADLLVLRDSFAKVVTAECTAPVAATLVAGHIVWGADRLT